MSPRHISTADLCDSRFDEIEVVDGDWRHFGATTHCHGIVTCVELYDDNSCLFDVLDDDGQGRILVIEVLSKRRPAVVGARVATLALDRRWAGLVINGAVRDVAELRQLPLCTLATDIRPYRLRTGVHGRLVESIDLHGTRVRNGSMLAIDEDGMILLGASLANEIQAKQT